MARTLGIFGTRPRMARPLGALGSFTWRNTTENPEVLAFQRALNPFLKKYGYYQIGEDGKLGPATCGAWLHLMNTVEGIGNDPSFPFNEGLINTCQAFTYPTKIGSTKPEKNPIIEEIIANEDFSLPWATLSADTTKAQNQMNGHLQGHGMNPIGVDGKMGGATCGAFRWLDQNTGSSFESMYGKNCQSFVMPTAKPVSTAPVATPVVTTPVGPETPTVTVAPVTTSKPKLSTASMVTGGVVLAGLAAAGWWYSKKKGFVANRPRARRRGRARRR